MLSPEQKAAFLKDGIFAGLDDETRLTVARRMGERDLADGETLFLHGEPGDEMFIILDGAVEIHIGDHVIAVLEAGQVLGEMAVLGGGRRTAGGRAKGPTRLLFLKDKAIRLLVQEAPGIAFALFKVLIDRLDEANRVALFLSEARTVLAEVEVVAGALAGRRFPVYHREADLGRARGAVGDALRIALPAEDDALRERHARVTVGDDAVFVEPLDGEIRMDGAALEDGIALHEGDTVELGGLTLAFHLQGDSA